jgi:hypothetical protein
VVIVTIMVNSSYNGGSNNSGNSNNKGDSKNRSNNMVKTTSEPAKSTKVNFDTSNVASSPLHT